MSDARNLVVAAGGTGARMARAFVDQWLETDQQTVPHDIEVVVVDARRSPEVELATNYEIAYIPEPVDYTKAYDEMRHHDPPERLEEWWPEGMTPDSRIDFTTGCGANRVNGRFFVARYGDRIRQAMNQALNSLFSVGRPESSESRLNTYILASLGNGTGGGTFMSLATMAQALARSRGQTPHVYGLFIPGTTTSAGGRTADDPVTPVRIEANGVASLIELQYEQNRSKYAPGRAEFTPSPDRPASVHTGYKELELVNADTTPFEFVYLFDRQNRRGQRRTYDELVEIAGRSLFSLLNGADEANRFLDQTANAKGPFGSMGFARMRSPIDEALEYTVLSLMSDATDWFGSEVSPEETHDELALQFGGDVCPDPTIEGSVEFFIDEMAQIREYADDDPFFEHIRRQLDRSPPAFDRSLETLADIRSAQGWIEDYVQKYKKRVGEATETILDGCTRAELTDLTDDRVREVIEEVLDDDRGSLPEAFDELNGDQQRTALRHLGVRWMLLHRVVGPLVDAGKFGVLLAWLEAFEREIEASRRAVVRNQLADPNVENFDYAFSDELEDLVHDFREETEGLMSFFSSGETELAEIERYLEDFYRDGRTRAEVDAVRDFYDRIEVVVDDLKRVARNVSESLEAAVDSADRHRRREELVGVFETETLQIGGGLANTVELIAGDRHDVEAIVAELREPRHSALKGLGAAMDALAPFHRRLFVQMAKETHTPLRGFEADDEEAPAAFDPHRMAESYANTLRDRIRDASWEFVVERMNLQSLLVRRAERLVDQFVDEALPTILSSDGALRYDREAREALDDFQDLVGGDLDRLIQEFRQTTDRDEARDRAVAVGVSHQLRPLVNLAVANWNPDSRSDRNFIGTEGNLLHRPVDDGSIFDEALDELEEMSPSPRPVASWKMPADRIDYLSMEVGGRIEDVEKRLVEPSLKAYRASMRDDGRHGQSFVPHTEEQYVQAGEEFLRWIERGTSGERAGALYLALAELQPDDQPELFGYIGHDGPNYEWRRNLVVDNEQFATEGENLPERGLRKVVKWLDGELEREHDSTDVGAALRDALRRDLGAWLGRNSHRNVQPAEWTEVVEALSRHRNDLRRRRDAAGREDIEEVRARQTRQLSNLVDDIKESEGDTVPVLLRG